MLLDRLGRMVFTGDILYDLTLECLVCLKETSIMHTEQVVKRVFRVVDFCDDYSGIEFVVYHQDLSYRYDPCLEIIRNHSLENWVRGW